MFKYWKLYGPKEKYIYPDVSLNIFSLLNIFLLTIWTSYSQANLLYRVAVVGKIDEKSIMYIALSYTK